MSRKAINIDKDQFEELLSLQCTKEDIAGFFHCSHDTIERWCKKTYRKNFLSVAEDYRSVGRVSLRRYQFAMAERGNVPMLIHLGKQYLDQSDKTEMKVSGVHGTVSKVVIYDPETKKTTEERIAGDPEDVSAYCEDPQRYDGDQVGIYLPEKEPDPEDLEGKDE